MSMIYGERVRLRAIERDDLQQYYAWVNDPEVTRNLGLYLPMSNRDEEGWFERVSQGDANERPLAIEMRDGGRNWKLIGNCGVFGIEWVNGSAELGIMIGEKSCWDQGYGTEVMMLLLRHCFETLNLHRVFLRVYADHSRGIRAYQKAGFVEEGRMREAVFKHGRYDDVIFMSVLRSEWQARTKEKQV